MNYWEENLGNDVELVPDNVLVFVWANQYRQSVF
jgi:hypothetical protein